MFQRIFCFILIIFNFIFINSLYADKPNKNGKPSSFTKANHKQMTWLFSGLLKTENQEVYGYFFSLKRLENNFHVQVALIDQSTKKLRFFYDKSQEIKTNKDIKWKIGKAFFNYNSVNKSWTFGVPNVKGNGFNFKVDMLHNIEGERKVETIYPGFELSVCQTNRLSGYIHIDGNEQFVTSKHAWFSNARLEDDASLPKALNELFCTFKDYSGFYAIQLDEPNAKQAAFAVWRDAKGNEKEMSQFLNIEQEDNGSWIINISIPKRSFRFNNLLNAHLSPSEEVAGFLAGDEIGFCHISELSFNRS